MEVGTHAKQIYIGFDMKRDNDFTPLQRGSQSVIFHNYREKKPPVEGTYIWRLPHKHIPDLTLVFTAKFRERGAGYTRVISPEFDYWDGYKVILPKGSIEWAEYDGEIPEIGHEIIEIEGVKNAPCPFCKKEPKWRYSGRFISSGPTDTDYYYLQCCSWVSWRPNSEYDPRVLAEKRNKLLAADVRLHTAETLLCEARNAVNILAAQETKLGSPDRTNKDLLKDIDRYFQLKFE